MGALDGIRVIDFGQYIAGPLAAVMLADQGAEVIHVDPPGGPRWKHASDAFYNRGKSRITLDLKDPADLDIARSLIDSADVVIENFRPGVARRLGIDRDDLSDQLIYCSIPGFASDDPRAGVAAWEGVVAAATDTYLPLEHIRTPLPGEDPHQPVYTALPLASNFAAFHAATAVVMALVARERSGRGQRIEVPMFDAMFELIGANGIMLNGVYPVARGQGSRTFVCQDGRHLLFNSSSTPRFRRAFLKASGADAPSAELFQTRPAHEWETLINQAGGPSTMVRSPAEWLHDEHARARGTVVEVDDPELGPTWMPGVQVHLSATPGEIRARHLPDADRETVLNDLDRTESARTKREDVGSALQGLRVLDFTQVVAGPCSGRILVEYGADVVKINNPRPELLTTAVSLSMRPMDPGNQQHEHLNRGKQTLLLDLHVPESREILSALIDSADVVMQNFAQGMAEQYGLGYEQVRARKPDIIYFSLSAYGYGGPMGGYRGFEGNAQAATGLMHRFGGDGPPLGQPYLLDDYGTGIRGAFAIALGVYQRERSGRGQHINISLVETATYHQAPFLLDYAGKVWDEPRGVHAVGSGPLHRLYLASDGWFFVGADSVATLLSACDASDLTALEDQIRGKPVREWVERLTRVGIGAHAVEKVETLMQDPWVLAHGLSLTQNIPGLGEMTMPGVAARLSHTPLRVGRPVNPVGSDAPAILASLGLEDRLDDLVRAGAVSLSVREPITV
jgi:crotonobetainyl-CoA:carnitine CoA-transferase CaiB-like acyl-CoA transferase